MMVDNRNAPPPTGNPADAPDSVIFQKFVGLKNTVSRERLGPDELATAINIDLDDAGQIRRRRGRHQVASGNYSSLFNSDEGIVYGILSGTMGIIQPDYSFTPLYAGFSSDESCVDYVQIGQKIYCSGRAQAVIIDQEAQSISPWIGPNLGGDPPTDPTASRVGSVSFPRGADWWWSPVANPTLTSTPVGGKIIGPPPLAHELAYYNGRIYLAHGKVLWATELYSYLYVDKTKNFLQFEADITMLGYVTDGIYVGTTEGLWFLSGPLKEMKRVRVMDSGVIKGSKVYIPGELANPPQVGLNEVRPTSVAILFMTHAGYCGGEDGGVCFNYTEQKFIFPGATSARAMYRMQDGVHQYIAVANSGGTPAANTRIGDHLDATIRRGGEWNNLPDTVKICDKFEPVWS